MSRSLKEDDERYFRQEHRCSFCDSEDFQGGPEGGISKNFTCCGCGARFNISPFDIEVIGEPTHQGCLHVRMEKELLGVIGWVKKVLG